ncbi:MAG: Fe-S cluster assembly protein SufD [Bacteroidia bacterium]|nr:Fe-S cluster assembly protein SufD [Bacteroidia bacterium]
MYIETEKISLNESLVDLFNSNRSLLLRASTDHVNALRMQAIDQFKKIGIPTKKDENYKYYDLDPVFSRKYDVHFSRKKIDFNISDLFKCDIPELDTDLLILLNGWYYENGNHDDLMKQGVVMGSLALAAVEYPQLFEQHYGRYADIKSDGLVAFNTAFALDGIFIYVPDNVMLERPVQIINIVMDKVDSMVQHRNLIVLGKNSKASIVICDHSLSANQFLTNSVTEIVASENSSLDYTRVQNEHNGAAQISSTFIHQLADSRVSTNTISLHGGFIRNNLNVMLAGKGCENNMYGLSLSDKFQHVDNSTLIDHAMPNCTSNQKFKGVMDDMASGVFYGKIFVRKDAQHTHAYQGNNNILLTDDAKINTRPHLEIYADDVKCSHGATVGQLDENAMFYLQSRGIGSKEARLMLMTAFAHEIIDQIKVDPLKDRIYDLVNKRLRGELSRCNSCAMNCN